MSRGNYNYITDCIIAHLDWLVLCYLYLTFVSILGTASDSSSECWIPGSNQKNTSHICVLYMFMCYILKKTLFRDIGRQLDNIWIQGILSILVAIIW